MQPLTPLAEWSCAFCGASVTARHPPRLCHCGAEGGFFSPEPESQTEPEQFSGLRAAGRARPIPVWRTSTELDTALGGGLPRGSSLLVSGAPGSGKTRCCLRWALSAGPTALVSLEMGEALATHTAQSVFGSVRGLFFAEDVDAAARAMTDRDVRSVVLDSVSMLPAGEQVDAVQALRLAARRSGGVAFVVAMANTDDSPRGSRELPHLVDVELWVRSAPNGVASIHPRKNRLGGLSVFESPLVSQKSAS